MLRSDTVTLVKSVRAAFGRKRKLSAIVEVNVKSTRGHLDY